MAAIGITIHYYGKIADVGRIEEFEVRVVDMALEIGAPVRVWRSWPEGDPGRVVRGVMLDVSPGQETTGLLVSPEGWLIPLHEIEAAENGTLEEPPHCWVKTQFGSVERHVAVVELLARLKQQFFPDLTVSDESGYWDNRDLKRLVDKFALMRTLVSDFAATLKAHPLSTEAAEDLEIVAARREHREARAAVAGSPAGTSARPVRRSCRLG